MTSFNYEAIDASGAPHAGSLDSPNRSMALEVLHRQGLTPLSLNESSSVSVTRPLDRARTLRSFLIRRRVGPDVVLAMTQSLAALLRAGLTIDRALAITAGLGGTPRQQQLLRELGRNVRAGRTFADALEGSDLPLPKYYVGMVRAGEMGGNLPQTLQRLAELLRQQHAIRERIRSALIYPLLLAGIVVATVGLLLVFVLPRFQTLFAEADSKLPWVTRAVLKVGTFVSEYWWLLFGITVIAAGALWRLFKSPAGRIRLDSWLVQSRWMLGLPVAIESARLLRTLGMLLASGVPIGSAMRISRSTLGNIRLREALGEAAQRIKAGEGPSAAFEAVQVFPSQVIQLTRVGEETGRLEDMMAEAASLLEAESTTKLDRLLSLLVPVLTIVMGGMIAGLIGSVLIGLLSVNELAF
jgi:general secretion pathway protein F